MKKIIIALLVLCSGTIYAQEESKAKFPLQPNTPPRETYGMLLFQGGANMMFTTDGNFTPMYDFRFIGESHTRTWNNNAFFVYQGRASYAFYNDVYSFGGGFGFGVSGFLSDSRNADGLGIMTMLGGIATADWYSRQMILGWDIIFRTHFKTFKTGGFVLGLDLGPTLRFGYSSEAMWGMRVNGVFGWAF